MSGLSDLKVIETGSLTATVSWSGSGSKWFLARCLESENDWKGKSVSVEDEHIQYNKETETVTATFANLFPGNTYQWKVARIEQVDRFEKLGEEVQGPDFATNGFSNSEGEPVNIEKDTVAVGSDFLVKGQSTARAGEIVIAEEINVRIKQGETLGVLASFTIFDPDGGQPNVNDITWQGFGQFTGRNFTLFRETAGSSNLQTYFLGDSSVLLNIIGPTNPNFDFIRIAYQGVTNNLLINAVEISDVPYFISAPEVNTKLLNNQPTNVFATFTLYDEEGPPDFGSFTLTGSGQFAGQVSNFFRDVSQGPNQRTYYVTNTDFIYLTLDLATDGRFDRITVQYKDAQAEIRVNAWREEETTSDLPPVITLPRHGLECTIEASQVTQKKCFYVTGYGGEDTQLIVNVVNPDGSIGLATLNEEPGANPNEYCYDFQRGHSTVVASIIEGGSGSGSNRNGAQIKLVKKGGSVDSSQKWNFPADVKFSSSSEAVEYAKTHPGVRPSGLAASKDSGVARASGGPFTFHEDFESSRVGPNNGCSDFINFTTRWDSNTDDTCYAPGDLVKGFGIEVINNGVGPPFNQLFLSTIGNFGSIANFVSANAFINSSQLVFDIPVTCALFSVAQSSNVFPFITPEVQLQALDSNDQILATIDILLPDVSAPDEYMYTGPAASKIRAVYPNPGVSSVGIEWTNLSFEVPPFIPENPLNQERFPVDVVDADPNAKNCFNYFFLSNLYANKSAAAHLADAQAFLNWLRQTVKDVPTDVDAELDRCRIICEEYLAFQKEANKLVQKAKTLITALQADIDTPPENGAASQATTEAFNNLFICLLNARFFALLTQGCVRLTTDEGAIPANIGLGKCYALVSSFGTFCFGATL